MSLRVWLLPFLLALTLAAQAQSPRDAAIDRYALAAPASAEASVRSLADYFCQQAKSDEEKARAVYRWIADRIRYDAQGFFSGHYPDPSVENVLHSRVAVCEGYSRLFEALAKACGLEAAEVTGYSKGYSFSQEEEAARRQANHAWNAVKIDGAWRLLDCTWGAGALNEERKFVKVYSDFWFLTRPEQFLSDHFPDQARWQLVDPPMSRQAFMDQIRVTSLFFKYGVRAISHRLAVVHAARKLEVRLEAPSNVFLTASLMRGNKMPKRPLTFVQPMGREQVVRAMFPDTGTYTLRIFARFQTEQETYNWIMDYRVESEAAQVPCTGYPEAFRAFRDRAVVLLGPLEGRLKPGATETFRIQVPAADMVVVGDEPHRTTLTREGSTFSGPVEVGEGPLRVYARFPGTDKLSGLLEYLGK